MIQIDVKLGFLATIKIGDKLSLFNTVK